jgi:hypothetical protein
MLIQNIIKAPNPDLAGLQLAFPVMVQDLIGKAGSKLSVLTAVEVELVVIS